MLIPNFNTLADAIDRLIVTVNKLAHFENKKREESLKPNPDNALIAHWDRLSRNECEYRNLLKVEINHLLQEVAKGNYEVLPDNRTFVAPPKSAADLISEMAHSRASEELARTLEGELSLVGRPSFRYAVTDIRMMGETRE